MSTKRSAALTTSRRGFGGSRADTRDLLTSTSDRDRENITKLATLAAERELEIVVVYAIGDVDGPASNQIRIGMSSRKGFPQLLENFALYRASEIKVHVAAYIKGRAVGVVLKAEIERQLLDQGKHLRTSWWSVPGHDVVRMASEVAGDFQIRVMTEADAAQLEREKVFQLMDRFA